MWRYIDGAKPPPAKKIKTKEEKRKSQNKYDNTVRKRSYQDSWEENRPWLVHEDSEEGEIMRCSVCIKAIEKDETMIRY